MARRGMLPELTVRIERLAAEGKAIAYALDRVLFVEGVVPGDVVRVQVSKKKANFMEGYVREVLTASPLRVQAPCPHFGLCGGCQWQMLPYTLQLQAKEEQVYSQLNHIGGVQALTEHHILGASPTLAYRNKLEFTFSPRGWVTTPSEALDTPLPPALGFHIPRKFDRVLNIEQCLLQPPISNEIRNAIRKYAITHGLSFYDAKMQEGLLRNLLIRITSTQQIMLLLVVREEQPEVMHLLEYIKASFPQITSLLWAVNPKGNDSLYDLDIRCFSGTTVLIEQLGDLFFEIGAKSFYQTNSKQALTLYHAVSEMADLQGNETVYDLYTGTGTIALYLARKAKRVVGIETVPEAIDDAKRNAARNKIENADFVVGDVLDILSPAFVQAHGKPDVLVTDPPRAGMHPKVVAFLQELLPPRIVYVSCNPATQARDLALLKEQYRVLALQPVDMFPHTKHVENIALLALKA